MNINELASQEVTTLQLMHPVTGEVIEGVSITGYTPDSKEWKKTERRIVGPNKKQSLIIEKGKQRLELDGDGYKNRQKLLYSVIISIDGLKNNDEPLELTSTEQIREFITQPKYSWMLEDWGDHLDERSNFFAPSENTVNSGSSASDGSTQNLTD